MIRALRAFLWMRWRLAANGVAGPRGGDALDRISSGTHALGRWLLLLLLAPSAASLAVGVYLLGTSVARERGVTDWWAGWPWLSLRVLLFAATLALFLAPLVWSLRGIGVGMSRLLLLPIGRRTLHALQLVGGFADPWLALLIPALFALPCGLAAAGDRTAALATLAATLLLLPTLVALAACAATGCALLFRRRRRAEAVTLLLAVALSIGGVFVAVVSLEIDRAGDGERVATGMSAGAPSASVVEQRLPAALGFLPTELYASVVERSLARDGRGAARALGGLGLWCAGLGFASWLLFLRSIESPEGGGRRPGAGRLGFSGTRRLGLDGPSAAIAEAMVRTALRSVRGRIAVFGNFVSLAALIAVFRLMETTSDVEWELTSSQGFGLLAGAAGLAFTLLALLPILFNQFGVDGHGTLLHLLLPMEPRSIVRGKLVGGAALAALSAGLCLAVSMVLAPYGDLLAWGALLVAGSAAYVGAAPVGVLLSSTFPRAADLSRLGRAGNPHWIAGALGALTLLALIALNATTVVAGHALGGSAGALGAAALTLAVSFGVSRFVLGAAARVFASRVESIGRAATES